MLSCVSPVHWDVQCSGRKTCRNFQFEGHASERGEVVIIVKAVFIPRFFSILDLPISGISSLYRKDLNVTKRVIALVHARYRVHIPKDRDTLLAVVAEQVYRSIHLLYHINRWGPFILCSFDEVHGEHSINLLLFEFSRARPFTIWQWLYRMVTFSSSSIRCCTALIKLIGPSCLYSSSVNVL